MRLNEWKTSNGDKVNLTTPAQNTTAASTATNLSFKKRLDKLIKYYGQHLPKEVAYIKVNLLTKDILEFSEYHNDRNFTIVEFRIYIGPTTEAWRLKSFVNDTPTDDLAGQGWTELLKTLRAYITVPVTGTPEYKELLTESLTEWIDTNGKKVNMTSTTTSQSAPVIKSLNTVYYEGGGVAKKVKEKAQRIVITSKVDEIYANTFNSCEELRDVILPETIKRIDNFAFYNCIKLEKINLPSSISFIADGAFDRCDNLTIHCEKGSYAEEFAKGRGIPVSYISYSSSFAEDFKTYENLWD